TGIPRMPAQAGVDVAENSSASHVQLAAAALFGRSSVETDGAGNLVRGHPVLDRNHRKQRSRPKQVMTATVAGRAFDERLAAGSRVLRECWKGIVLAQHCDHGFSLPPTRRECRWDSSNVVF